MHRSRIVAGLYCIGTAAALALLQLSLQLSQSMHVHSCATCILRVGGTGLQRAPMRYAAIFT